MKEVKAVIRLSRLDAVLEGLKDVPGMPAITVSRVARFTPPRGTVIKEDHAKLEVMVPAELVETVLAVIQRAAHTGKSGDGRIFVIPIEGTIRIRTGERSHGDL